jgi:hypothetical protein
MKQGVESLELKTSIIQILKKLSWELCKLNVTL